MGPENEMLVEFDKHYQAIFKNNDLRAFNDQYLQ